MTPELIRRWWPRRRDGTAAVELALISPLLMLMLAGLVDFGRVYHDKIELASVVAAAGQYALLNASSVTSGNGATMAASLSGIVANTNTNTNDDGSPWAGASVTVNAGPTSTVASATKTSGGTAANANSCWCPTGGTDNWNWGSAATCGTACASGTRAGKFVTISGSRAFSAIFGNYGLISNTTLRQSTIVQTQ